MGMISETTKFFLFKILKKMKYNGGGGKYQKQHHCQFIFFNNKRGFVIL